MPEAFIPRSERAASRFSFMPTIEHLECCRHSQENKIRWAGHVMRLNGNRWTGAKWFRLACSKVIHVMEANASLRSSWKNPRERLKKHLRKAASSHSLNGSLENVVKIANGAEENHEVIHSCVVSSRSNPFKRSSPVKKRRRHEDEENLLFESSVAWDDSNANDPFSNEKMFRNRKMKSFGSQHFPLSGDQPFENSFATGFSDIFLCDFSHSAIEHTAHCSEKTPVDLRLGTKLRITAKKPFLWMRDVSASGSAVVRITGQQRHEGLRNFINAVSNEFNSSLSEIPSDLSPLAVLESACLYWQFPCFPWLPTYPRADSLVNASSLINHSTPLISHSCLKDLEMQWIECFDQLFLSWKKGDRKSFYMSCCSFTVLFTKINLDDDTVCTEDSSSCFQTCGGLRHIVIVTPSTSGFRQYLKSEGIEYEVVRKKTTSSDKTFTSFQPLDEKSCSNDGLQCNECNDVESVNMPSSSGTQKNASAIDSGVSPEKADVSGDNEWLENIGMSPGNTAKLKRYKSIGSASNVANDIALTRTSVDDAAAILVKGSHVQTLYNLMQTSKVCRSIIGPHANIPPTLLSSSPFLYAQLQTLKKSSQVIRKKHFEYILELDGGPIMPHTIPLVVEFVRRCGVCDVEPATIRMYNQEPGHPLQKQYTTNLTW
ncbi:hypothetical protein RB195_019025 [Necator americanus]|uniref:Uncharacterized protein n=1 Tax=Necator americanus TaxID=51031 RepID=A0ABR1CF50_NECAM